ncbi:hypothetical protein BDK51DRAFT_28575 [Blyttiomyces helicus]|uniref:Uncharacterized protein n=1 Tax=Blyttiomyces helicus TaxID=388810 RepID=A0A4P9WIR5_9FUNG|nr:hypothetical protein BDK51DRAFT_28575 [Blyttiomyces helicus]|eukprot:RKO92779.1 hypothetical protein BDK51DRAFT_28575 [Blyttiomyces helicus]
MAFEEDPDTYHLERLPIEIVPSCAGGHGVDRTAGRPPGASRREAAAAAHRSDKVYPRATRRKHKVERIEGRIEEEMLRRFDGLTETQRKDLMRVVSRNARITRAAVHRFGRPDANGSELSRVAGNQQADTFSMGYSTSYVTSWSDADGEDSDDDNDRKGMGGGGGGGGYTWGPASRRSSAAFDDAGSKIISAWIDANLAASQPPPLFDHSNCLPISIEVTSELYSHAIAYEGVCGAIPNPRTEIYVPVDLGSADNGVTEALEAMTKVTNDLQNWVSSVLEIPTILDADRPLEDGPLADLSAPRSVVTSDSSQFPPPDSSLASLTSNSPRPMSPLPGGGTGTGSSPTPRASVVARPPNVMHHGHALPRVHEEIGSNSRPGRGPEQSGFECLLSACRPPVLEGPMRNANLHIVQEVDVPRGLVKRMKENLGLAVGRVKEGDSERKKFLDEAEIVPNPSTKRLRPKYGAWHIHPRVWNKRMHEEEDAARKALEASQARRFSSIVQPKLEEIIATRARRDIVLNARLAPGRSASERAERADVGEGLGGHSRGSGGMARAESVNNGATAP